jgi:hypothetical protein
MRIYFERTGGFAGMVMTFTVDTASLPLDEAHDLTQMVDTAGFFDLPAEIAKPVPGADRFHYQLTVEAAERQHTVEMGEAAVPETLQPLLRRLMTMARSRRGS